MRRAVLLALVAVQLAGCASIRDWIEERRKPKLLPEDIDPRWRRGVWDRTRVDDWPVTIKAVGASLHWVGGHEPWEVRVSYERLQDIPKWFQEPDPDPPGYNKKNVNGTIFLVREFRGEWVFASIDYLRVGQTAKRFALSPEWLIEHNPGKPVGVLVSTVARQWDGTRVDGDPGAPYRERSNIVWTKWPE